MKKNIRLKNAIFLFLIVQGGVYSTDLNITNNYTNDNVIEYANSLDNESNLYIKNNNDIIFSNKGTLNISYEESELSLKKTIYDKGHGINIANSLNRIDIKNSGLISGKTILVEETVTPTLNNNEVSDKDSIVGAGNGINSYGSLIEGSTMGNIENTGLISGKIDLTGRIFSNKDNNSINNFINAYNVGNGISSYVKEDIGINTWHSIKNDGLILGEAILRGGTSTSTITTNFNNYNDSIYNRYISHIRGSGNGISFYKNNIVNGNIENDGVTSGKLILEGGTAVFKIDKGIPPLTGDANVEIESTASGNGISFYNDSSIKGDIKNKGIISGEVILTRGKTFVSNNIDSISHSSIYSIGNGISSYFDSVFGHQISPHIENIENKGIISGKVIIKGGELKSDSFASCSGNGISSYYNSSIGNITNNGVISGYIDVDAQSNSFESFDFSGNGIAITADNSKKIINSGVIKGSKSSIATNSKSRIIENYGVMAGREIYSNGSEFIENNSGVTQTDLSKFEMTAATNYGIYIQLKSEMSPTYNRKTGAVNLDSDGDVIIQTIFGGSGNGNSGKIVLNTAVSGRPYKNSLDSFNNVVSDTTYDNNIINGAGIKSGVLTIGDNIEVNLNNSIVNSYKTAIMMGNNSNLIASNSIFNGGGLINQDLTINGGNGKSSIEILGDSFVNGKINLGNETDSLVISTGTTLNDDINGGDGIDVITLKKSGTNDNLRIFHKIENFENITLESGNVTLYETSKIIGAKELNLKAGSQLNVRIDTREKDAEGTYTGNALYGNNLIITGDPSRYNNINSNVPELEGAKYEDIPVLNIVTNGLGIDSKINFGKIEFQGIKDDGNVDTKDDLWVKTDSILDGVNNIAKDANGNTIISLKAERELFSILKKLEATQEVETVTSETSTEIAPIVVSKVNPVEVPSVLVVSPQIVLPVASKLAPSTVLPVAPLYKKIYVNLNEMYKGIYTSGNENFDELRNILKLRTADKNNYISEKIQLENLLSYLGNIYSYSPYSFSSDTSMKSMSLFRNIAIDNNFKANDKEWLFLGGLTHTDGTKEQSYYGKNYHGFDTGVYDKDVDTKIYGAYAQAEYGLNKTLAAGMIFGGNKSDTEISPSKVKGTSMYLGGYLKKDIDNLRLISGAGIEYSEYDADRYAINRKYNADYSDKAFEVYISGRYKHKIIENLYLEPYSQLSYAYVTQDEIKENDGPLSLNINSKDFSLLEGTVGVDIRKDIVTKNAKHSVKSGVSYTRLLDGAKEDNLTATFGGRKFELLVPHKVPNEVRVGVGYEVENNKGVILGVKTDYLVPMDSEENNYKNNNKGEWRSGVTVGYRF